MNPKFLALSFFVLSFYTAVAQNDEALQTAIDNFASSQLLDGASVGVSVFNIAEDREVGSLRPGTVLTPASSLKVITSFLAWDVLGPDYNYKSKLCYSGKIGRDGTLTGDIVFEGSGDPSLGSSQVRSDPSFRDLLKICSREILRAGINCIDGDIVADESVFNSFPICPTWQWNDLGNYYACGAWGINIHDNLYFVNFKNRTQLGALTTISNTTPYIPDLKISNEVTVDGPGTGDNAYIFGGPYNYVKRIVGTIPQGPGIFTIKGSIPDPPLFLAFHLKNELARQNIEAQGYRTQYRDKKTDDKRHLIFTFDSSPLKEIIKRANFHSDNLYSEALLKTVGLRYNGQGSGQNGIAAVVNMLSRYRVKATGMRLHDGCGLSARNKISPHTIASFLSKFTTHHDIEQLVKLLPRGGYDGTVRGMFSRHKARGHVFLKSGSMEGIQSYSGYIQTASGHWLSFCVMVNGYSANGSAVRRLMEKLIGDLYTSY